jgi:hypothetical protein
MERKRVLIVNSFDRQPHGLWTGLFIGTLEGGGFEVTEVTNRREEVAALVKSLLGCSVRHNFHMIIYNGQNSTVEDMEAIFKTHAMLATFEEADSP